MTSATEACARAGARAWSAARRASGRAIEPAVLSLAGAVLVLCIIWMATANFIRVEKAAAEQAASVLSNELAETYEAQVVRALREIDQTLKVVKYAFELQDRLALDELEKRNLLPPDLLFVVSVADRDGVVIASTRASALGTVPAQDVFRKQVAEDLLAVGLPRQNTEGEWLLDFSRRLSTGDGEFAGVVMVTLDAGYFVSGYDTSKLGERGVLAILGSDGIFRAVRTGETFFSGGTADYAAITATPPLHRISPVLNTWDDVRRYTSSRELFGFPLTVVVGLSVHEQMAAIEPVVRGYLQWAGAGSVLLILVSAVVGSQSSQLARSRERAVQEQIAHAARVEHLAYHDGLTSLPNRSLFSKLLGESIRNARTSLGTVAVLFMDLDRFKQINDTLGHQAGDRLLQEVAHRLRTCVRPGDTVARLGGDEFVILLPEPEGEATIAAVAREVIGAIARPYRLHEQEFRVTASIGISTYPRDGLDEQTLTKNADIAMYHAKEMGKNNFQFYAKDLNGNSLERLNLESGLRHALEKGELDIYYQPKRETATGRITGVEALLRWQHPDLGTIAPMQFLPIAEETGLIVMIGRWVLRTACQQHANWLEQGLPALTMAVNLSARQFMDDHLLADLTQTLAATGMDPRLLELEITEGLLIRDVDRSLSTLARLKAIGVRIAIADFGSGYLSLSKLEQFPIDTIKIDRSFIRDVATAADDKALMKTIIAMGRNLSMRVVAQGVEVKEQADFLLENACDELQGFYFNPPMPAGKLVELLRETPATVGAALANP